MDQRPPLKLVPRSDPRPVLDPLLPRNLRQVQSPEQLWDLFEIYVEECEVKEKPMTLAGVILALGFSSRDAFNRYGTKPEYREVISRIRLSIEEVYETRLHGPAAAGAIKWLSVHAGYTERVDIGNPNGETFKVEGESTASSELELLRKVGFMLAANAAKMIDGEVEQVASATESATETADGE